MSAITLFRTSHRAFARGTFFHTSAWTAAAAAADGRRTVTPIAGRTRIVSQLDASVRKPKKPASWTSKSTSQRRAPPVPNGAEAAGASAGGATAANSAAGEQTFLQRNKQAVTQVMWTFVMFFMGIQVLRGQYEKDAALEDARSVRDELASLRGVLSPDAGPGSWFERACVEARLTEAQRAILGASLGSVIDVADVVQLQEAREAAQRAQEESTKANAVGQMTSSTAGAVGDETSGGSGGSGNVGMI